MKKYKRGKKANVRPVEEMNDDGTVYKYWTEMRAAAEFYGINYRGISQSVCRGYRCNGRRWRYYTDPDLTDEIWKDHPSKQFLCSNLGRIWKKSGQKSYGNRRQDGYFTICVGGRKNRMVHRLILEAWEPTSSETKLEVDHSDGDHGNNRLSNLSWVTHAENMRRFALALK